MLHVSVAMWLQVLSSSLKSENQISSDPGGGGAGAIRAGEGWEGWEGGEE